ncbi:unnamed protein product [Pleuronectes platessa]|uniref:Uncharacterized protein n=1 Tax=Pleuronectes platessa TaxID=8262 RepID=A0A9N7U9U9_PLEPL|nr:unnamed protein product [Pleuronectes platessa]
MDKDREATAAALASVNKRLTALESNHSSGPEPKRKRRGQCPKLAETVRRLHNSETDGRRYDPEQSCM